MTDQDNQAAWDQGRADGVARAKAALAAGSDATYTAQPGDTFESIAEAIYGDTESGAPLFAANAGMIGSTATGLAPGHVLQIPYRPASAAVRDDAPATPATTWPGYPSDPAARPPYGGPERRLGTAVDTGARRRATDRPGYPAAGQPPDGSWRG